MAIANAIFFLGALHQDTHHRVHALHSGEAIRRVLIPVLLWRLPFQVLRIGGQAGWEVSG